MKEPDLVGEARKAKEASIATTLLFHKAEAIAQKGEPLRGYDGWKIGSIAMLQDDVDFNIEAIRSDVGDIFVVFDSLPLRRILKLPKFGVATVVDADSGSDFAAVLHGASQPLARKANLEDVRQFDELLGAFEMRAEFARTGNLPSTSN